MGWFDDFVDGVADVGSSIADGVSDAVDTAGDVFSGAADTAGNIFGGAVDTAGDIFGGAWDTAGDLWTGTWDFAGDVFGGAWDTAGDLWSGTVDIAGDIWDGAGDIWGGASDFAGDIFGGVWDFAGGAWDTISDGAEAVGGFFDEYSNEILTGLEIAGTVALSATGVGAVGAAAISGGIAAGSDLAQGKDAGEAALSGIAAAADKLAPGSGQATEAVVNGIADGKSVQEIMQDAGLDGIGGTGGPLGLVGTVASDVANGKDAGEIIRDGISQYVTNASGTGTGHGNLLGQAGVIGVNGLIDGKSAGEMGLDLAKAYLQEAAGGDSSPTAKLIGTLFDGIKEGKSASEIGEELLNEAAGIVNRAAGQSDIPGSDYAATVAEGVLQGKSAEEILKDVGEKAAGDALDEGALDEVFKDLDIDTSALDPWRGELEGAAKDIMNGKDPGQVLEDMAGQAAGKALGMDGLGGLANSFGIDLSKIDTFPDFGLGSGALAPLDTVGATGPGEIMDYGMMTGGQVPEAPAWDGTADDTVDYGGGGVSTPQSDGIYLR